MKPDALRKRIRSYEDTYRYMLPPRSVILFRGDGCHFHTLTRSLEKPFDDKFKAAMDATAMALCKEISGAALAYVESDEISVLVVPYRKYNTEPWFSNGIQKMCSVGASIATAAFNKEMSLEKPATFDMRVFALPREEACNAFIDRQRDCVRNSILSAGQEYLGKKVVHGLNCTQIVERLGRTRNSWEELDNWKKFGRVVTKTTYTITNAMKSSIEEMPILSTTIRSKWVVDAATPMFHQDRRQIDYLVWPEGEEGQYSAPVTGEDKIESLSDIIASADLES